MEDSDWTDLPLVSCVDSTFVDHEEIFSESSTCLLEKGNFIHAPDKENGQLHVEEDTADNIKNEEKKSCIKEPLNPKQEKDSCPICLSSFEDRSFLDQCFHSFCFCCILQWCEVVQTCPLCKSGFGSVIHSVKSMQDYEQYIIEKKSDTATAPNRTHVEVSYDQRGFDERGNRFRYRTTRQVHVRENNTSHQRRHSENRATTSTSEGWGDEARSRRRSRHRQKPRNERIKGIEKRRQIYGFKLRAVSMLGNGKQRCRNTSSKFYKSNPACTHRLIPWLLRDLRVLLGNSDEEINFLMEFIISLIARIDMDSEQFLEELRPFLLDTTEHFVHELLSFAKAPFDLNAYDECVVYPWPEDSNDAECSQNTASVLEERINRTVHIGRTPLENRTPLSHCEWSDSPEVLQGREEDDTLCRVLNNESLEHAGAARLNTAEISETNNLNARISDMTRVSEEDSPIATPKRSSPEQNGRNTFVYTQCDSVNERIASMPSSSVDNVPSKSEIVTKDCLQDLDSTRHKKHKHDGHKHKDEENGRKSLVHGQSDSLNERIASMPSSLVDNVPSQSEGITRDSLQDCVDSSRPKRRKNGKHKHGKNGRKFFVHGQSDLVNERIASMPSPLVDNVPSESEGIARDSLQDCVDSSRPKRRKHKHGKNGRKFFAHGQNDSLNERIASMPSSSVDNVPSQSEGIARDSLQDCVDSSRPKRRKHGKRKREENGRNTFVYGQSDSVNECIASVPYSSSIDNVPSQSEVISRDSLQGLNSTRHKRHKHKHEKNGRKSLVYEQSDSLNERIASLPSSLVDNVPSKSEVVTEDNLQDWDSTRHTRDKHDRPKRKHKHKRKHKRKHERSSEHNNNTINPVSGSVSSPIFAPYSTSGCISDSSAVCTERNNVHIQEPLNDYETKCPSPKRRESPSIECMFKEINELDAKIQQHEELLSLAEMDTLTHAANYE